MAYSIPQTQTLAQWRNTDNDVIYQIREEIQDPAITMNAQAGDEMIKITNEGFWVRGKRVEQDDKEAETVYNAFKQWLAWANLQQQR